MNHLKIYEDFEGIQSICKKYGISEYAFLEQIGKPTVESVKGYKII